MLLHGEVLMRVAVLLWSALLPSLAIKYSEYDDDTRAEYWIEDAQRSLGKMLKVQQNINKAKNVIVFVGDGMGIPSITASRIYKGQKSNQRGEETVLAFEKFPYVSLIKTYNVDRQVPDSAGTATAIFSGVKSNYETLGLSPSAERSNCEQSKKWEIESLLTWAQKSGRSTGIVTTTRITHATPAALYSHVAHRDWECDSCKPANASKCKDIALQLVEDEPGRNLDVILGGGRRNFLQKSDGGKRQDDRNLLDEWAAMKDNTNRTYVNTAEELRAVNMDAPGRVMGLFAMDHLPYELDRLRLKDPSSQPSLKELTQFAIKRLQRNNGGFFLHVEGGRIDHAHHETRAKRAFEDTLAMEAAIREATLMTSSQDTLIVVTADHSHVMTINGYPERGNNILSAGDVSDVDHHPYTTIMYTTGPGHVNDSVAHRKLLKQIDTRDDNYTQLALVPNSYETHGGEDVALYAQGPFAHLFQGVQEQNYITHAISYAACMGPKEFKKMCDYQTVSRGRVQSLTSPLVVLCLLMLQAFLSTAIRK